jgi:phosphoserine phosphatase
LISVEFIDELARAHGVLEQVAQVTEAAMAGEMDYDESLRRRMALLEGLDVAVMKRIATELPLTDGAERLIRALRRLGYRTAVISGGFSIAADMLKTQLGIAFRAKLKLRAAADTSISAGGLDSILYLLGLNAHEVDEVLASADLP